MTKVIHIRDVPDDVHEALTSAARAQDLSLTRYLRRELEHLAGRAQAVQHNSEVVRRTRARVQGKVDRETILAVLDDGRGA